MPEFFSHLVDVSKSSMNKMRNGADAMIKRVGSGVSIHLGEANHKKCMNAYKKNKGCRIKLSAEEIVQNDSVDGSGFFQTLHKMGVSRKQFNKGTKVLAKTVAPLAQKLLPQLGEQAGQAIGMYATKSPMGGVAGATFGKQLGYDASNALKNYGGSGFRVAGAGFRPVGSMYGQGIANLRPEYPDGYSNILPVNHPIYNPAVVKVGFGM